MRCWPALELIEISESGASLGAAGRALLLLEAGGMRRDEAEALALGARDRALFQLRKIQFGARMEVAQSCKNCGEVYEFALTAADLGRDAPGLVHGGSAMIDGHNGRIAVRAITAGDLAACEGLGEAPVLRDLLRMRVAPGASARDDPALDAVLAELDADAELAIAARCPDCDQVQEAPFDIAAFFWDEITLRVPRLLQQVADLARVNHWSESDILALPPARRRFYLLAAAA